MRFPFHSVFENSHWFPYSEDRMMPGLSCPSLILPEESPDSLWHIFGCTGIGIVHYVSTSALSWERKRTVLPLCSFPFAYTEGGKTYLLGTKGKSSIIISSSSDYEAWSRPSVIAEGRDVSNPGLVMWEGGYWLYYSDENRSRIMLARSYYIEGPYENVGPVIETEPWNDNRSLSAGFISVVPCSDKLAAFEVSVFYDEENNSEAARIYMLSSSDAEGWKEGRTISIMRDTKVTGLTAKWKADEKTWYCYISTKGTGKIPRPPKTELILGQLP